MKKLFLIILAEYITLRISLYIIIWIFISNRNVFEYIFYSNHMCWYIPNEYSCSLIQSVFVSPLWNIINIVSIVLTLLTLLILIFYNKLKNAEK
ncbi:MAG: hypothetical protein ACD_49C00019G0005 [uncultured bacterium (gcode 4)]|uniref:Uncharacterized protein n=1 Tax=uncultured bacterium (gcode 4) TaxID=1234023 RepID=K2AYC3_9BACT|nr:MAG: hypothetical protein ACD_49C00019G0005 [uncultured bacterium (gcode 4)]